MNKLIGLVLILIVIGVGAYWMQNKGRGGEGTPMGEKSQEDMKNVDALQSESDTAVTSLKDVEYYPGAHGFYVRPADDNEYPGIVMIHENRGLRPEIKMMAEELAKEGYLVLAVDLFGGKVVESQDEARQLTANFDQAKANENLKAAVNYLKDSGATKMASLGWCFGGRQSLALATSGEKLDATVVYYGGGMPTTKAELAPIKWSVLGIFGDKDQAIPVEKVKEFQTSLTALGVQNEIHIYPGVGHAFANPSGMNYAPAETKDAWMKTVDFLEKNLGEEMEVEEE